MGVYLRMPRCIKAVQKKRVLNSQNMSGQEAGGSLLVFSCIMAVMGW